MLHLVALLAAGFAEPDASRSRWGIRDDPGRCVLTHVEANPPVELAVETTPGSDVFRVAVARESNGEVGRSKSGALTFDGGRVISGKITEARLPEDRRHVAWMEGLGPDVLDHIALTSGATMTAGTATSIKVAWTNGAKAVAALRRCTDTQLIEWGADPAQFEPGGTPPGSLTNRDGWLDRDDYLKVAAVSEAANLHAVMRVGVTPAGVVDTCDSVRGVPSKRVSDAICKTRVGKLLFKPALDPAGKAVRGVATFEVRMMSLPVR